MGSEMCIRDSQEIEQPERFFTGKFLDLAIANTTELEQQLSGTVQRTQVSKTTPQPTQVTKPAPQTIRENVQFELSGVLLDPGDIKSLNTFSETVKGLGPNVALQVTGHSSDSGSEERKSLLSKGQVETVATYLRQKGLKRLKVKRVGSNMPLPGIAPTDPRNQRVEIAVSTGG